MKSKAMPLVIADMGSFYAGGRSLEVSDQPVKSIDIAPSLQQFQYDPNGTYAVEGCYVQYFIPEVILGEPCLLIHGGGLTGVCWETTPDGREGWVNQLLRAGRPVYVADMMERGRAGWVSLDGVWDGPALLRNEQEAWWLFRFGAAANYQARKPFEGQRFPVESLPCFMKQSVPRWTNNVDKAYLAFEQALARIGRCTIMTHSSGSVYGYRLAFDHPEQVSALISLEASTFPQDCPADLSGQVYLEVVGDFIDEVVLWQDVDKRIRQWSSQLAKAGANAEYWRLADHALKGHSHMLMMDKGNEQVLELLLNWLKAQGVP